MLRLQSLSPEYVAALIPACWPDRPPRDIEALLSDIVRRQTKDHAWGLVALAGDQIVGFGQLARWRSGSEISDLVVSPAWRGRGAGTALIHGLLDIARHKRILDVEIGVAESNLQALDLYRRLGFEDRRRILTDVGDGLEEVIYLGLRLAEKAA